MLGPELVLRSGYVLDARGRIVSTREPNPEPGPCFVLVRSATQCAWAVHADVPDVVAAAYDELARAEAPARELPSRPAHADDYLALARACVAGEITEVDGPEYRFADVLDEPSGIAIVEDERTLAQHFHGWVQGEIAEGRAPVCAIVEDGHPVSICFCARRSDEAAEAGVETAVAFQRRGHAVRVTAAWANAIRRSGRIPLYSTTWNNHASRAVARVLGCVPFATFWRTSR